ncbi:MAG: MBL fold metallo-hydrolase [Defluviitaleaceae bacterium]|nr:MBL fold metallo-hydrolase [Defluviitaleaceae bacterium]
MELKIIQAELFGQNIYVYHDGVTAVIIDPGDNFDGVKNFVAEKNLKVKAILLTHGHFDHIYRANEVRELFGAPVYAHSNEAKLLQRADWNRSEYRGLDITVAADNFFKDGDIFEISDSARFSVIHTPGHTGGGVCYYDRENAVIFTGDTLFRETIGRTDMPTGDHETLLSSIRNKLFSLPDDVKVYPGHEGSTTIAHEKKNNSRADLS